MKEFKINDFLTLKLEAGKTNIYVNGELFNQCKHLMLNIPIEDTARFDEIESIDEAADILGWTYDGQEGVNYKIDPDTGFWGHCSNLQAWYENDYDTRLLHSNLAFPLLKRLTEAGDPIASKIFKEEIAKRFENGYPTVVKYIINEKLLSYLDREELKGLINEYISYLFKTIGQIPHDTFSMLLKLLKEMGLIKEHLPTLLSVFDKLPEDAFSQLLEILKEVGLNIELFPRFWEAIDKLSDIRKYRAFSLLVKMINDSELLNKYYTRIETEFCILINNIDKLSDKNKIPAFFA